MYREADPREQPRRAAGKHAARMHARGALGNDIGIMAEARNERNDERADGLEPGPGPGPRSHRGPIEGGPRG